MNIVTLRKCTMRSRLGFGKYPDCTVAEIIAADRASWIREAYYTYETIDFTDEVKEPPGSG